MMPLLLLLLIVLVFYRVYFHNQHPYFSMVLSGHLGMPDWRPMAMNITDETRNSRLYAVDPLSDGVRDILQYINTFFLAPTIGFFGIFTNIINIIVYKRYYYIIIIITCSDYFKQLSQV